MNWEFKISNYLVLVQVELNHLESTYSSRNFNNFVLGKVQHVQVLHVTEFKWETGQPVITIVVRQ